MAVTSGHSTTKLKLKWSYPLTNFRSLWIANLAVQRDRTYETLFNRAVALQYESLFDDALEVFLEASQLALNAHEAKIEAIRLCAILDKKELAYGSENSTLYKYS